MSHLKVSCCSFLRAVNGLLICIVSESILGTGIHIYDFAMDGKRVNNNILRLGSSNLYFFLNYSWFMSLSLLLVDLHISKLVDSTSNLFWLHNIFLQLLYLIQSYYIEVISLFMVHIFPRLQVTGKIGAVGATVGAAAPWWQGANMPHGFLSNPGSPASSLYHFFSV